MFFTVFSLLFVEVDWFNLIFVVEEIKYIKSTKYTVKFLSPKFLCNAFFKEFYYYLLSINAIYVLPE